MSKTKKSDSAEFIGGETSKRSQSETRAESTERKAPESALPGIHVIGEEDFEEHFGEPETGAEPALRSKEKAKTQRKTTVHANIDAKIWLRATKLAGKKKLTVDDYVEKAIDGLNNSVS